MWAARRRQQQQLAVATKTVLRQSCGCARSFRPCHILQAPKPIVTRTHPWHAAAALSRGTSSTPPGGGQRKDGRLLSFQRWLCGTRTRVLLAAGELRDRADEWRQRAASTCSRPSITRWRQQDLTHCLNKCFYNLHAKWRFANRGFDSWFNARCAALAATARRWIGQLRLLHPGRDSTAATASTAVALDTPAMLLLGAGTGSCLNGCYTAGACLITWGVVRGLWRFLVTKLDANDVRGLFRWAPHRFRERQGELFQWLKDELYVMRSLRKGETRYMTLRGKPLKEQQAMSAQYDHTPETLYADTMASLVVHPRVLETLGGNVHAVAEPDKVVYRIHEGISEVFLGWQIRGSEREAEIQVKASACIVDFIYVFPHAVGRYGLKEPGFVIRPWGNWSKDCNELPWNQKRPFGEHNGRMFINREAVFEYDYEVRDFRHGYEDHPRKQRRW